jgi:hypothetical protein
VNPETCQIKTGHSRKLGNIKNWPNLKRIKLKIGQLKKMAKLKTDQVKNWATSKNGQIKN